MGDDSKSGTPRWILIATGFVGLVAAILVAATKYYEFHKARAEALKPGVFPAAAAGQPTNSGAEPKQTAPARPPKVDPKGNSKSAGGREGVFPTGMYEGAHTHARGGSTPTEYAVQLRDDGSCRRVTLGQNVSEARFEFRDNQLILRGGIGGGFVEAWLADGDQVQVKLWYPASLYPDFAPVETGSLRRRR